MLTLRLRADSDHPESVESQASVDKAAAILREGGLVAFPTETVYGLGANALDEDAVRRIFAAKERPAWDPLIVHVFDREMAAEVAEEFSPAAALLADKFWPGPLTMLLPKRDAVPALVTAGRPLVGLRIPAHPIAHRLIQAAGVPIAAPSANLFGHPSPTSALHVLADLDGRIDAVLDGGETVHGLESTVIDATQSPAIIYRPGAIILERIQSVCDAILWTSLEGSPTPPDQPSALPSPGVGIRHYAPRARLLLSATPEEFAASIRQHASGEHDTGVMLPGSFPAHIPQGLLGQAHVFEWGSWDDPEELAHRLFAGLRALDAAGVELILCPAPPAAGLGVAICDRLLKAARPE